MRLCAGLLLLGFSLALQPSAAAATSATVELGPVEADGRVLIVDLPDPLQEPALGNSIAIHWVDARGRRFQAFHIGRAGSHAYEMRDLPGWSGKLQNVAIRAWVDEFRAEVRRPSLSDELDIFLNPQPLVPRAINVQESSHFFGFAWTLILAIVALLAAIVLWKSWHWPFAAAALGGFVIAWALLDLRQIYSHFSVAREIEANDRNLPALTLVKGFTDDAAPLIGQATWRDEEIDAIDRSFVLYALAEHRYSHTEPADFVVTTRPASREIVLVRNHLYLVRGTP